MLVGLLEYRIRAMSGQPFLVRGRTGAQAGHHILIVSGPLTSTTCLQFLEAVSSAQAPALILDLTAVPYVDSMAIGSLVQAYVSCRKAGRKLALAGLSHRVAAMLRITSIEPLFAIYPTAAEAESGLA